MESYIADKKKLYTVILEFLENFYDTVDEECFERFSPYFKQQDKNGAFENMEDFLRIIKNISDEHHRDTTFITRTKQLLLHYKSQIKQTLSNDEVFNIFEDNKLLVHFLLTSDIIRMTEKICKHMMNMNLTVTVIVTFSIQSLNTF